MQKTEKQSSFLNKVLVIIISLLVVTAIAIAVALATSRENNTMFAGKRPTNLGVQSGQLTPCPNSPNCVSSFSQDNEHKIEPLVYTSTSTDVIAKLKKAILSLPRTQIITETNNYLYAEFTSTLMGFVDDVEFLLDEEAKVIQVRSASRLGESDLGVNRKRIETLRSKLNQLST